MINIQFLFIRKYTPDREIAIHTHSVYEFVYYYNGKGVSNCGNDIHSFDTDSFSIISPNIPHDETHVGTGKILAIGFTFNDASFSLDTTFYNGFHPTIHALAHRVEAELRNKEEFYEEIIKLIMWEIILYLKRDQNRSSAIKNSRHNDINYAISFINEYFATNINLNELANSVGYSTDYFSLLFKKKTGFSPKNYILSKKLTYAKNLLLDSEISLNMVATSCGFDYYSAFSAFFKKETGMSPLDYRNKFLN